jgi:hypothetical protein
MITWNNGINLNVTLPSLCIIADFLVYIKDAPWLRQREKLSLQFLTFPTSCFLSFLFNSKYVTFLFAACFSNFFSGWFETKPKILNYSTSSSIDLVGLLAKVMGCFFTMFLALLFFSIASLYSKHHLA